MLYIFDRNENLITILKNDGNSCPYFEAVHTEKLTGENTFTFSVPADHSDCEYVQDGSFVAFKDLDNNWQMFEILREEDTHEESKIRTFYCEHVFYELLYDFIEDKRPYDVSAHFALTQALDGTRWSVGEVADLGINSTNFYRESVLSAVQKVAQTWGGELRFRVVVEGGQISGRYVDLLPRRGADTGKQFVYSKDIKSIKREEDLTPVITAAYGYGKGVEVGEGYSRRITFADVEWNTANGDPVDKPLGQTWVGDPEALQKWGRAGGTLHRFGVFDDSEEEDPAVLLQKTWEYLQQYKEPRITYELDVIDLERLTGYEHERVRLGDTVRIIDREFKPELLVEARVIEINRDLLKPEETKIVLGQFAPSIVDENMKLQETMQVVRDRQGIWDTGGFSGPVPTSWLDGIIDTLQNEVRAGNGSVTLTNDNGIMIVDDPENPTKALRLLGGLLAISNEKDPVTGDWIWRTFGTGDGFTADLLNAGQIRTSLVQILGNSNFYWDGDYLYIVNPDDGNQQIRLSKEGIRFTRDGGQTWRVAMDFDGIRMEGKSEDGYTHYTGDGVKVYDEVSDLVGHLGKFDTGQSQTVLTEDTQADFNTGTLTDVVATSSGNLELARDGMDFTYVETTQADFQAGTLTNVVATSAGDLEIAQTMGKALSFDGVDDYVDCGAGASLNITGPLTVEAWINPTKVDERYRICGKVVASPSTDGYLLYVNTNKVQFGIRKSGSAYNALSTHTIAAGTLVHVAGVYDGNNVKVYVDGQETVGDAYTGTIGGNAEVFRIGTYLPAMGDYFPGLIDEVRVWNVARTQQQIQDNMNKELTGNEPGLVGYWKLNEGTGTTAYDSTANGNNGTINGATWVDGLVPSYKPSGTREKIVDISGANPAGGTKIEWSKTTPTGTTVTVETALSLDGGTTWQGWQVCTNGGAIPGITSETDLSNARLQLRQTLATNDTTITPQLHDVTINLNPPYKTAGYRESPAFGISGECRITWEATLNGQTIAIQSNLSRDGGTTWEGWQDCVNGGIIPGTDTGNLSNAKLKLKEILTTTDILKTPQLHKVVVSQPIYGYGLWSKNGYFVLNAPPVDGGIRVYDAQGNLRTHIGQYAAGKYGAKVIGGEVYSTRFQTGDENSKDYIALVPPKNLVVMGENYLTRESTYQLAIMATGGGGVIYFYDNAISDFDSAGNISAAYSMTGFTDIPDGFYFAVTSRNRNLLLNSANKIYTNNSLHVRGNLSCSGTKPAIQATESYGLRALYARESPELKFVEEGIAQLVEGQAIIELDPMFLETIEPNTPQTPWLVMLTPYADISLYVAEIGASYIVIKERNNGVNNARFAWSLSAIRKGYARVRMEQFDAIEEEILNSGWEDEILEVIKGDSE